MASYRTGETGVRGMTVRNRMRLRLPSLSVNEGMARAAVAAFCVQADLSATDLADIKCAVSEAVTNCIVHAYRDRIGEIQLTATIFNQGLISVEIKDRGCGIEDVRQAREPLYTTDREGERSGMGFAVMESFCDGVRVSSVPQRGTTVVLYKRIGERDLTT